MGAPPMAAAGAGAASGVTNTAVTTTQEHMKSDKGQVLEMSKQQQTKKEVKEMAIPISLCGGAKQARSPRPRFLPFEFSSAMPEMKMPSGDELMAQVMGSMAEMQQATTQQVQAMTQQAQ